MTKTPEYDFYAGRSAGGASGTAPGDSRSGGTNQFGTPTGNQFGGTNQFGTSTGGGNQFGSPGSAPAPAPVPPASGKVKIPVKLLIGGGLVVALLLVGAVTGAGRFGFLGRDVKMPAVVNGMQQVELPPELQDELVTAFEGAADMDPGDLGFAAYGTSTDDAVYVIVARDKFTTLQDEGVPNAREVGDGQCAYETVDGQWWSMCTSHGFNSVAAVMSFAPSPDLENLQKTAHDAREKAT